jgi:hypothetical protein
MQVRFAPMWRPLLVALVLVACGGAQEAATTTTEAPTTTVERTTTTQRRTTTTERRTTTTQPLTIEQERAILVESFEQIRPDLIQALEANGLIRSVDNVAYDSERDQLVIAVTSNYSTEEYNEDLAWELTTELRTVWGPDGVMRNVPFPVGLALDVSDLSYRCPGEFMFRLGDHRATRSDWLATCA